MVLRVIWDKSNGGFKKIFEINPRASEEMIDENETTLKQLKRNKTKTINAKKLTIRHSK